ncbi:MAG: histidinol-phosphate transaminase [Candidatus Theseobacter exili]|nr:histidinol-phosphate transaminase [Candidatus Theseobacter exili]
MSINYFRSAIENMEGYVPGEQPIGKKFIKLNTNENPYPPSPKVFDAVKARLNESMRLYPDSAMTKVKEKAATIYGVDSGEILVGNGSDDILSILIRTVVGKSDSVALTEPTYSLYKTLAEIQEGRIEKYPLTEGVCIPEEMFSSKAKLVFLARPNAPTGASFALDEVERLARSIKGVLLIDEAYADFADDNCLELYRRCDNIVLSRTLSKSYSLAGIRLGLAIGRPEVITQMTKVKDSYNVNALTGAAAIAALDDVDHMQKNVQIVKRDRAFLKVGLSRMGIESFPSQANFVMTRFAENGKAKSIFSKLREAGFLVRYFHLDYLGECLRITVGKHQEVVAFLDVLDKILHGDRK